MSSPLQQCWEARKVTGTEVMRMIDELDPVEHATEITHLSMEVLVPPIFAYLGYAAGFARTLEIRHPPIEPGATAMEIRSSSPPNATWTP